MTHRILNKERTPLWVALGAPLIGVPVMVGLLALGTPRAEGPMVEPVPMFVTEPADTHPADPVLNDSAAQLQQELNAG